MLYVSREVDYRLGCEFMEHTRHCNGCRRFLTDYLKDRELFTPEMLGERTSPEIDREILRVCSGKRTFFTFIRSNVLVPALIFIIGFVSVGYIVMNAENAKTVRQVAVREKDSVNVDSTYQKGNLNTEGVTTVNLKR